MADYPIAIVGLGSIFPQADDISEFWSNVTFGRDAVTDVPPAWWDPAEHFDPNPLAEDKTYARRGGFISPQTFDPRAFGMAPNSLDSVGLVQLLSLAVARGRLADAVRGREGWYPLDRTGVILGMAGVSTTLIPLAARLYAPALAQTLRDSATARTSSGLSGRLSWLPSRPGRRTVFPARWGMWWRAASPIVLICGRRITPWTQRAPVRWRRCAPPSMNSSPAAPM
ncbi:beta-ketoacyl synthase N-terminal-like domain-containing protein [Streptomyces huasconensis]|uniref:Beta-ketoacyl synthase N-terminal-like domain-containing protein n=1 Tax=Streptomyces huasconensis TaxID=1854574 RepID=A0ABV3M3D0_9ACTN